VIQLLQHHKVSVDGIPRNLIYEHPSISSLIQFILDLVSTDSEGPSVSTDNSSKVKNIIKKYTQGFSIRPQEDLHDMSIDKDEYVVITGTTGSLGSFLLDNLIDRPSVKRIYCFNRYKGEETSKRQLDLFLQRGLDAKKLAQVIDEKVIFHDVDLSQPRLGLSEADYESVRLSVREKLSSD
jgi:hypothetical protein